MKALRWYSQKDIRYEDIPEPSPGPKDIKVKISLAGICGSDLKEYVSGPHKIAVERLPLTTGHEFAGKVVEVGEGITDFKAGERVAGVGYRVCGECFYCKRHMPNLCLHMEFTGVEVDGCMAEYLISPAYSLYKLPGSLPDEAGALVEPLSVAIHAVRKAGVCPGDTVAIVGDGTIGLCSLLAARAAGASEVYVVAKHKNRGKIALTMGATEVIYAGDGDPVRSITNLTGGLGVDVSMECAGRPDTPQLCVGLVRRGGRVVLVGTFDQPGPFDLSSLTFDEKTVVGSSIYIDEGKAAVALMADKRIEPVGLVTSIVPLKEAVKMGFEQLLNNKEDNIKILIQVP